MSVRAGVASRDTMRKKGERERKKRVDRFDLDLVAIAFAKLIVARVPVSLFTEKTPSPSFLFASRCATFRRREAIVRILIISNTACTPGDGIF